jgi:hypothetical protein
MVIVRRVSGRPGLPTGPGSRRSGVRAGHGRWLAAWSMHQAKAYLLDHRYAIDPSGMYHDWAIGDPLVAAGYASGLSHVL